MTKMCMVLLLFSIKPTFLFVCDKQWIKVHVANVVMAGKVYLFFQGVPIPAIKVKMAAEGLDPDLLE